MLTTRKLTNTDEIFCQYLGKNSINILTVDGIFDENLSSTSFSSGIVVPSAFPSKIKIPKELLMKCRWIIRTKKEMLVLIFFRRVHQKLIFDGILVADFIKKCQIFLMKWVWNCQWNGPICWWFQYWCFHNFFWLVVIISLICLVAKRLVTCDIITFG